MLTVSYNDNNSLQYNQQCKYNQSMKINFTSPSLYSYIISYYLLSVNAFQNRVSYLVAIF